MLKKFLYVTLTVSLLTPYIPNRVNNEATVELTTETTETTETTPDNTSSDNVSDIKNPYNTNPINLEMTMNEFQEQIGIESELYGSMSYEEVFQLMKNNLDAGEPISLSEAFNLSGGLTIPSNMMYDLSESGLTGSIDSSKLNAQYAILVSGMMDEYTSVDLAGQSIGAVNLFNENYGDIINNLRIEKSELPEDWNMNNLVSENNRIVNEMYSEAFNNSNYINVRTSLNISNIMKQADAGAVSYELQDSKVLQEKVKDASSEYHKNSREDYFSNRNDYVEEYMRNTASLDDVRNKIDSCYVDEDGNLITPYTKDLNNLVSSYEYDAYHEYINEHPTKAWALTNDENYKYVDDDSNIMTKILSGYTGEQIYDTVHKNKVLGKICDTVIVGTCDFVSNIVDGVSDFFTPQGEFLSISFDELLPMPPDAADKFNSMYNNTDKTDE